MIRLGYAAQNLTIPASTNHSCRLAGLSDPEKVRALVWRNLADLELILRWNAEHGIPLFRIGQSLIPFASHPDFPYDWEAEHGEDLAALGDLASSFGARLSMHPAQFIQPASPRPGVSGRSLDELHYAARVLDLIGGRDAVIVLHLGGAYGDRPATAARFVEKMRPHKDILKYLALENDETVWTVSEVAAAATELGVPAILDSFHHGINPGGLTLREAADLALPTWDGRGRPKLHLSSQDPNKRPGAHAPRVEKKDWLDLAEVLSGKSADVMVEAKDKEKALDTPGIGL